MRNKEIFALGLGLEDPWRIRTLELEGAEDNSKGVLHIHLDYEKGSTFYFEGESYPVYDHQERTWQHLNFFDHKCFLHARVPRIKTKAGNVKLVSLPWAQKGGFLLFALSKTS